VAGNVRELRNALEHAVIVANGGPLLPDHFPVALATAAGTPEEQLRRAVLMWLVERIGAAGRKPPSELYENC